MIPDQVPTLTGERVVLRGYRRDDAAAVTLATTDPLIPLITSVPAGGDAEHVRDYIERQLTRLAEGRSVQFVIADRRSDQPLGQIGLSLKDLDQGRASIGYWIAEPHRGRGLASEALHTLVDWASGLDEVSRLELYVEPWNVGSCKVAESAGFVREGLLCSWQLVGDQRRDMFMYGLEHGAAQPRPPIARPEQLASRRLRSRFEAFVRSQLADQPQVAAVVLVGSVATGMARPDSDVDAYLFLDPFDPWLVPAESIWRERDDTFHSIFSDEPGLDEEGLQLDLHRIDLADWACGEPVSEAVLAELSDGVTVFDRGDVEELVTERLLMSPEQRRERIDRALIEAGALIPDDPDGTWAVLGPAEASDRPQAGVEALARVVLAEQCRWEPFRGRLQRVLARCAWRPRAVGAGWEQVLVGTGAGQASHRDRALVLRRALTEVIDRLATQPDWQSDPVSRAFRRVHDEPGRAWNLEEWNARRSSPVRG